VRNFSLPAGATLAGVAVLFAVGVRNPFALVGFGLCLFVSATILQEFIRGTAARRLATGEAAGEAFFNLVRRNNRRYGGYVVHLAIILIGVGVIGSTFYKTEEKVVLRPGQSMQVQDFTLTFNPLQHSASQATDTVAAPLVVKRTIPSEPKVNQRAPSGPLVTIVPSP